MTRSTRPSSSGVPAVTPANHRPLGSQEHLRAVSASSHTTQDLTTSFGAARAPSWEMLPQPLQQRIHLLGPTLQQDNHYAEFHPADALPLRTQQRVGSEWQQPFFNARHWWSDRASTTETLLAHAPFLMHSWVGAVTGRSQKLVDWHAERSALRFVFSQFTSPPEQAIFADALIPVYESVIRESNIVRQQSRTARRFLRFATRRASSDTTLSTQIRILYPHRRTRPAPWLESGRLIMGIHEQTLEASGLAGAPHHRNWESHIEDAMQRNATLQQVVRDGAANIDNLHTLANHYTTVAQQPHALAAAMHTSRWPVHEYVKVLRAIDSAARHHGTLHEQWYKYGGAREQMRSTIVQDLRAFIDFRTRGV